MALERLVPMADDTALHDRLIAARRANKAALATLVAERLDIAIDPDALIDVHIKRIHEYKRQLLNILETIALYQRDPRPAGTELGATREGVCRHGRPPATSAPS